MTFISYAQNFEDVMLWRALKYVEKGFYIDVGANDPSIDSVTKAFYARGWHGINIEPLATYHANLLEERPQDINLQCAAGATNGEIEIWESDVRGWATLSLKVVAQHTANGFTGTFHKVPISRLSDICEQHVSGEIHFLKIDVEGFEKSVIDGMDFSRFRPWILVIEATKPNSTEEIHDEWEGDILSADYLLAYTDGINRFYVSKEQSELLSLLRYPPNVFDGFVRQEQMGSELRAEQAEAKAEQAEAKAEQAEAKVEQAEATSNQYLMQLRAVYASTSWRITTPFRKLLDAKRAFLPSPKFAKSALKTKIKLLLAHVKLYINRRPKLQLAVMRVLAKFPNLNARLKHASFNSYSPQTTEPNISTKLAQLTPRARQIYEDLKNVIQKSQEERS